MKPLSLSAYAAPRTGLKGPRAAEWLIAHDLPVPPRPNSWLPLADDGLIGRLAASEFFIEGHAAATVARALGTGEPGVYPVLRRDAGLALSGVDALGVLAQTCNIHFAALALDARPLLMTSMIGVSVLVIPERKDGEILYRIWCDPTFGPYLLRTLQSIVAEEGSGDPPAPSRSANESATSSSRGGP